MIVLLIGDFGLYEQRNLKCPLLPLSRLLHQVLNEIPWHCNVINAENDKMADKQISNCTYAKQYKMVPGKKTLQPALIEVRDQNQMHL